MDSVVNWFGEWSFAFIDAWDPTLGTTGAIALFMVVTIFLPLSPLLALTGWSIYKTEQEWQKLMSEKEE